MEEAADDIGPAGGAADADRSVTIDHGAVADLPSTFTPQPRALVVAAGVGPDAPV